MTSFLFSSFKRSFNTNINTWRRDAILFTGFTTDIVRIHLCSWRICSENKVKDQAFCRYFTESVFVEFVCKLFLVYKFKTLLIGVINQDYVAPSPSHILPKSFVLGYVLVRWFWTGLKCSCLHGYVISPQELLSAYKMQIISHRKAEIKYIIS